MTEIKNDKIYNLTTHFCGIEGVEQTPRMKLMDEISNPVEAIHIFKRGIKGIPRGSKVLAGGHPQYISLTIQLSRKMGWEIYLHDSRNQRIYRAAFFNRTDIYEMEAELYGDTTESTRVSE